jgi:hypothetical protein
MITLRPQDVLPDIGVPAADADFSHAPATPGPTPLSVLSLVDREVRLRPAEHREALEHELG